MSDNQPDSRPVAGGGGGFHRKTWGDSEPGYSYTSGLWGPPGPWLGHGWTQASGALLGHDWVLTGHRPLGPSWVVTRRAHAKERCPAQSPQAALHPGSQLSEAPSPAVGAQVHTKVELYRHLHRLR